MDPTIGPAAPVGGDPEIYHPVVGLRAMREFDVHPGFTGFAGATAVVVPRIP